MLITIHRTRTGGKVLENSAWN